MGKPKLIFMETKKKLGAGISVKGFQELVEDSASAPAVKLQSVRIALTVIAYRKWNFRVMDFSRAFLRRRDL